MLKKQRNLSNNIESIISSQVEIKGEINSSGSVRIDGSVEGRLNIHGDLILGEKGKIKGEIQADNVILAGRIEGNVLAKGRLEITATGTMLGDASCNIIVIDEGGVLDGTSRMSRGEEKSRTPSTGENKKKTKTA